MTLMIVFLIAMSAVAIYNGVLAKRLYNANYELSRTVHKLNSEIQTDQSVRLKLARDLNRRCHAYNDLERRYELSIERHIKDKKMYQDLRDMYINLCGHLALQYISAAETKRCFKLNNELDGPHPGALGDAVHTLLLLHSTHKTERLMQKFKKTA